jgi:hypothetical protein
MKILRPEVENDLNGCSSGGMNTLMDILFSTAFNVTLDELDYIAEHATDDEVNILISGLGGIDYSSTFTEKRESLMIRNKFLELKNKD